LLLVIEYGAHGDDKQPQKDRRDWDR
jgi:hypothetical protein